MDLLLTGKIKNYGVLDYVCCWHIKAADYIQDTGIKVALVATNSITQGEQVGVLWKYLFKKNISINFAHRTFKWSNEASNNAQVFVVIIGLTNSQTNDKYIYDYVTPKSDPVEIKANNINPYLVDYENTIIVNRNSPISSVPEISFGNMPNDDGNLLFTDEEKKAFLKEEPNAKKFVKPLLSSKEYLNGRLRWCLWLDKTPPNEYRNLKLVLERIEKVKTYRQKSTRAATNKLAKIPYLFGEIRQSNENYILIPRHSSENRSYIPMGFFNKTYIVSDSCLFIPKGTLFHFGILMSSMHMAWVKQVCGRIKSDYRYSNNLVYNNFPFPESDDAKKKKTIEEKAQNVLNIRAQYTNATLSDLYDPKTMPKELVKAHQDLDKAVDKYYTNKNLPSDLERFKFLLELYKQITEPLLVEEKNKEKPKKNRLKKQ